MKKYFALGVLLLSVSPILAQEKQVFSDVPPNHWAFSAVQKLAKEGILKGYPEGEKVEKPVLTPTPTPQAKPKLPIAESALSTTPRVKMALINEVGLRGIAVDVDTDTDKQQVLLRGTALNQKQKDLAGAIARKHAKGYKTVNLLKVIRK